MLLVLLIDKCNGVLEFGGEDCDEVGGRDRCDDRGTAKAEWGPNSGANGALNKEDDLTIAVFVCGMLKANCEEFMLEAIRALIVLDLLDNGAHLSGAPIDHIDPDFIGETLHTFLQQDEFRILAQKRAGARH